MNIHVRWMIRRDLSAVLEIKDQCFGSWSWDEEEFVRCLRQRNCIGMVAEQRGNVAGYMIYELHKNRIHVLNFAVAPQHRLEGVGKTMVDKLVYKLSPDRRDRIMLEVRETNLDAQLFFHRIGFRAVSVLRDFYDGSTEDAYLMVMRYRPAPTTNPPNNRIAGVISS